MKHTDYIEEQTKVASTRYLGCIDFDETLEVSIGYPESLVKTNLYKQLAELCETI
jgi:hypothetical protein